MCAVRKREKNRSRGVRHQSNESSFAMEKSKVGQLMGAKLHEKEMRIPARRNRTNKKDARSTVDKIGGPN